MSRIPAWFARAGVSRLHGAPEGYDARLLGYAARTVAETGRSVLHVARDDTRQSQLADALAFFAPEAEIIAFPSWDCLPYDRVSPHGDLIARRLETLGRLARAPEATKPRVIIATISGVLQRLPPRSMVAGSVRSVELGDRLDLEELTRFLIANGYGRSDTVREAGEYALRGGILDVYPPGESEPLRLDLFGDVLETIRAFDPMTQRSTGKRERIDFLPMSELILDEASIARFRSGYRALFGAETLNDPLYNAISAGQKHIGMEHWLPLFHDTLETLLDYLPAAAVSLDHQADGAVAARFEQINEFYDARRTMMVAAQKEGNPYHPLPPDRLYLTPAQWEGLLAQRAVAVLDPAEPADLGDRLDGGGRLGRDFGDIRARSDLNVFDAVRDHVTALGKAKNRILFTAHSDGSRERLRGLLRDHGLSEPAVVTSWDEALAADPRRPSIATLGLIRGFSTDGMAVITEGDILGDRLIRSTRRKRAENFLQDHSALNEGDLVVHVAHGIGRYDGLETIDVGGAPHDCLRLVYAGGDKLFVPVENIDALSRFGSEDATAQLDKLGGVAWQARKAKVRQRIRLVAEKLIAIAAEREIRQGEVLHAAEGLYDEFAARFPYAETDDQLRAIEDIMNDMASGKPMDRLVCGDVGFGKTEVALRAAFIAALSGQQVAVVVPTTLLARQHFRQFEARFKGLPVRVEQLSRLVTPKRVKEIKAEIGEGKVDIVVGTHSVLSKGVSFKDLGLLIIDEEQHFGVGQKEKLKELKANIHVLTLTATPIPRTLQMALAGVRDMSIIATPPVDRLAVRTFVLPYDPVVIREAILRERFRGGQSFYVCPRIEDLDEVAQRIRTLVPDIKLATAHGRMPAAQLEDVMNAFCDGAYEMLLSTNIVESGLDIPTANTMILHRADMFGLAQTYQLRGRIGRSKLRGYCYLTLPPNRVLTPTAQRRLDVMQTLDQLGAGFQLASHDMDIRGAGNLLGDEQSGHIKEVGIELYQHMLEEAVTAARAGKAEEAAEADEWSPQITVGTPVLIPDSYVEDLGLRLSLYRRVATLASREDIDGFAAELIDRFGPLPAEVDNLLRIIEIKRLCRLAGVEKIDAGPKGAVVTFYRNRFAAPEKLVAFITKQAGTVKLRQDQKLVFSRTWERPIDRVDGVQKLMIQLVNLVS